MIYKLVNSKLLVVVLMLTGLIIVGCNNVSMDSMKQHDIGNTNRIRLEHVAINVENPEAMVKWYRENLGMKLIRKGPPPVNMHFISDAGGNMMLEVYNNPPDAVPDYRSMNPLSLHIAFMVDDVKGICRKLTAAGATIVSDVSVTEAGDEIAMLRDPWGVPIQFLKRAEPMLLHK
jgi:catechol 2,3-dioxygenase-like lactoylglutathione lyase family enzyme